MPQFTWGVVTYGLQKSIFLPGKEMTNSHHRPELLEDRGTLSLSEILYLTAAELQLSFLSSLLWVRSHRCLWWPTWRLHDLNPSVVWLVAFSHYSLPYGIIVSRSFCVGH